MTSRASEEARRVGIEFHERQQHPDARIGAPVQPVRPKPVQYHDRPWAGVVADAAADKQLAGRRSTSLRGKVNSRHDAVARVGNEAKPLDAPVRSKVPTAVRTEVRSVDLSHPVVHPLLQKMDPA
jgi:hypothetical protein